jgi:hypothetical protein
MVGGGGKAGSPILGRPILGPQLSTRRHTRQTPDPVPLDINEASIGVFEGRERVGEQVDLVRIVARRTLVNHLPHPSISHVLSREGDEKKKTTRMTRKQWIEKKKNKLTMATILLPLGPLISMHPPQTSLLAQLASFMATP